MAKTCTTWEKKAGKLVSRDRRFTILKRPARQGYYAVDLDTYNDISTNTLASAKKWACMKMKRS